MASEQLYCRGTYSRTFTNGLIPEMQECHMSDRYWAAPRKWISYGRLASTMVDKAANLVVQAVNAA